jgi:hypothetical protein
MSKEPLLKNKGKDILWPVLCVLLFGMLWGVVLTVFVQRLGGH